MAATLAGQYTWGRPVVKEVETDEENEVEEVDKVDEVEEVEEAEEVEEMLPPHLCGPHPRTLAQLVAPPW